MTDTDRPFWNPEAQTLAPATLERRARDGLAREWERAWGLPIPFYRDRFEAAGLSRDAVPALDDIPRTTKDDLRADEAAHPPFGTHRSVHLDRALRVGGSTGTSGTPVLIAFGPRDLEAMIEFQARTIWRYGIRPGDRFTHSWPQGFYISGTASGFWYVRVGVLEVPVGPPTSLDVAAEHLRMWQLLEPQGFMMTSSQLQIYEEAASASGIDLHAILAGGKLGLLEASCQFEGPRKRVETTYDVSLRNLGGIGEIPGFGLSDCEHHTGLHVPGDHVVAQVCDPVTGRSLPEGERGHLVLSTFDLDAFFVRYDVEDIVTMTTEPCPCGETGPRYTLLGRGADAAVVDGRSILPIDVQLALFEEGGPEFQLAVRGTGDALRVRVEADGDGRRFEGALHARLGVPVEVEAVAVGSLPRSTFKPRRTS